MKKKVIIIIVSAVVVIAAAVLILSGMSKEKEPVISYYEPGDYFVTNIKDSTRLLKAAVVLELTTDKAEEYLSENNHIIRDIIVFTLREQTEQALRATGVENELRSEIVAKLAQTMNIDYIQSIYFNEFVIQ